MTKTKMILKMKDQASVKFQMSKQTSMEQKEKKTKLRKRKLRLISTLVGILLTKMTRELLANQPNQTVALWLKMLRLSLKREIPRSKSTKIKRIKIRSRIWIMKPSKRKKRMNNEDYILTSNSLIAALNLILNGFEFRRIFVYII